MIVTVTANPSLDRAVTLAAPLRHGEVQPGTAAREDAGGKGINVSRVVAGADAETLAVLPLAADDPFAGPLEATGIATRIVPIAGQARSNLTILDPDGTTTKVNLAGSALGEAETRALIDEVVSASDGARWLVLAGSVPPGAGTDLYVRVIRAVRERCADAAPRIAVDTSGAALQAVVEQGLADLIKPNDEELAELAALPADPTDPESVERVARTLVPHRVRAALVTLGAAGAVLVTAEESWFAVAPRIVPVSTVGAGDSSLAGYLLAESAAASAPDSLRQAVRYGAAAATLPGTQAPLPSDLPTEDITVRRIRR